MKKILPALVFSLLSLTISAQILNPVKWSFKTEKISDTEFELVFTAKIDDGWYIHSQFITGDGPIPTSINFDKNKQLRFAGKIAESGEKEKEEFDEVWGFVVKKFYKKSVFRQRVIVDDLNTIVRGSIEFGTCNEITGVCLPPAEIDFSFSFPKSDNSLQLTVKSNEADSQKLIVIDSGQDTSYSAQSDTNSITSDIQSSSSIIIPEAKNENPKSLWGIFIAGFIGGLLALLTPCVFPIIPMTVSFFTKTSKDRNKGIANAVLYGLAIIVIYVGLGFIVTKALGADALNDMASSAFFNLAFFVIFVVFAVSFFGYFEITLPSSFVNKMDSMSDRGGLIGIFFMAFTLSLVSFSCTGPIIGTLLVEAAMGGSNTGPLIGMFGFSLALALPFGLFAAFPAWLNSLPKSGGWLNSVKVILGFLELGLALKFLSNVDLAYHWGFLKREIFLGIWLLIAVAAGLYLLGKIRFPHDSPVKKLSAPRIALATIFFAFALYLVPGLKGANLKLLSGFPPPMFYSVFETKSKCPHDINCFKNLDEGLAYARIVNKPVMVDFTGWSCVNCRKMEENVWVEPEILKLISKDYVLVSLYVDDKTLLPEAEQKTSECTGRKIRTVGNKWSEYQTCVFKANIQPYYVLMNHKGEILNTPVSYTPDADKYRMFLEEGLERL